MSKFFILRTEDRKGAKDDYIICVNPSIKKSKHLGRFSVLVHKRKIDKRLKELKVPCRVVIEETLNDSEVRCDQSLRNAPGKEIHSYRRNADQNRPEYMEKQEKDRKR